MTFRTHFDIGFGMKFALRRWNHISHSNGTDSLDIISSQGKVDRFRILSKKIKQKITWKQKSKTTTMLITNFRQMFLFYTPWTLLFFRCVLGVKKGNIGLKWIDNSGREIISIRNNATLIYGINVQSTTSTSASNNNVINGVTIFISEKLEGLCEWYFKSDIAEFEFDHTNKIKLKTFIGKIRNLTKFFIFFSSSFKPLMTWSIDGRKT